MKALAVTLALLMTSPAAADCRQALALGLDVSGSVDEREYRLQLDGLASALGNRDVAEALTTGIGGTVRLAIYEWSDPGQQRVVLDWTEVTDLTVITQIQSRLRSTTRADMGPSTGLGAAMQAGLDLLAQQPDCWTRTLDISGDGKGNTGPRPQSVTVLPLGVTINGLVIGAHDQRLGAMRDLQIGELAAYYTAYVIRGPDAFVEAAYGFEDFEAAMERKLLRELTALVIGQTTAPPTRAPQ